MNNTTQATYGDVAAETTTLIIDAIKSSNERALQYWKSVWDIVAAPAESTSTGYDVRAGFDRLDKVVNLTVQELETSIKKNAHVAETLIAQSTKLQQSAAETVRTVVESGLSSAKQAVETTNDRIETLVRGDKARAAA